MAQRIVVIGGGIMGLAAAWQLVRRGERPVVIDRFARGHHEGASHGETRNFNNAYGEAHYLDLLALAREGWDALGDVDGEPLLRLHGLVSHGGGAALGSGSATSLAGIADGLTARGIPAELLTGADAARRWPGMRFEDTVLHSPDAGVARAAAAIRELERRITAGGGEVRWSIPARALSPDADGVDVVTDAGTLRADVVVVTAGAWTSSLLGPALGSGSGPGIPLPPLRVTEETPAHFTPFVAGPWLSFNHFVTPGSQPSNVYGMPTPGEGIKVGFHGIGDEVDPDRRPHRPVLQHELRDYVREWMPGLDPDTAVPISCTYTSTPTEAFVLDRVERIVVGAGFSGQGFKFAPGVGATLAALALDPSARAAEAFRLASV
ncbi:FAD-dependent oxidoreductase [Microbacterium dextranolyticum]|uniref:N-methyl-L-tryptophan oxidase n=1 Tax=Microbacterium dextranolyticum TaxID=36806 RepID=A0A9W6HJE9_9MICO|nr:FAD-dependent oxidoreductase [Microbacterium dextranolyticum]MBM7462125.1 sarcosine oxidase [Microbacterium dextranolyticum]GLJ94370.1 N-methyl-L-tryptophan oxidase [Microbacterium dextranolyticum]